MMSQAASILIMQSMKNHKLVYKLIISIISVFLIATLTFFLFELMPGSIYSVDNIKSEVAIQNIIQKYGLDRPIQERYLKMLQNLVHLDFGNSFVSNGLSVREIIAEHFPISMWLGTVALAAAIVNGVITGAVMNHFRGKTISKVLRGILMLCYSFPTFEIAVLAQYYFCVKMKWFPVVCSSDKNAMLLPIMLLSLTPMTFIARLVDVKLEEERKKDHVMAARLRGVGRMQIFFFYKLKNCLTPIITLTGSLFASMIAGSFVIETIYSIPGLGKYFVTSIVNRDYPLVLGLTIFYSILVISVNYVAEVLVAMNSRGKVER